jgi:hypothetical protein
VQDQGEIESEGNVIAAPFFGGSYECLLTGSAPDQALYDLAAAEGTAAAAAKGASGELAPPQLYVDGFDAEQIWLQLEMQSADALKRARRLIRKAGDVPRLVLPEMEEALDGGWPLLMASHYA